jgi:MoxR-like ATPase
MEKNKDWFIFKGDGSKTDNVEFPKAPPWRKGKESENSSYIPDVDNNELEVVNASIYLKRPILVTGNPGTGKSSLAYAIAKELGLEVVKWEITTKSTLKDGLYSYDAIARLQDVSLKQDTNIDEYLFLGALGYAFSSSDKPKVLLIDEIDKSDIDLPNDLLHILEEMEFVIPELERADRDGKGTDIYASHKKKSQGGKPIKIENGKVTCNSDNFPIIIMTSNDEREFPPAFLRRCLRLDMKTPNKDRLIEIIEAKFNDIPDDKKESINSIVDKFLDLIDKENLTLSTDQLLNAIHLLFEKEIDISKDDSLGKEIFRSLV